MSLQIQERREALSRFLCHEIVKSISPCDYDEKTLSVAIKDEGRNREYLVLTDEEADDAWEDSLDNYIEELILPEIPELYRFYFDEEKWKDHARTYGRSHSLSPYDGVEENEEVNGTTYCIFRTN